MAVALVVETYLSARLSADRIHDNLLVSLAFSISEYVVGSGGDLVPEEALALMSSSTNEKTFYRVTGPGNAFITGHDDLPPTPKDVTLEGGIPFFYEARYQNEDVRMVALTFLVEGRDIEGWMVIQAAQTRGERDQLVRESVLRAAFRILLVIGLAVVFAWIGVVRGLAPLKHLQDAIRRRSYNDLRPIAHEMPVEIAHVVQSLNRLLERLSASIDSSQRFVANASHQLRTPLAALQAETELALRDTKSDREKTVLESVRRGTKRTSRLANQLLSLARARPESGGDIAAVHLDLNALAANVTVEWVPRALDHGMDLGFEGPDMPVSIMGNETLLHELLSNLIDNALHYCPAGAHITVRVYADAPSQQVALEVEDNGPGIPDAMKGKVLERFVRLDERAGDGCGLGLAIVHEIVEGHGGALTLADGQNGCGLLIRVSLPTKPTAET